MRHGEAKCLGCLEVDNQFIFGGVLHWQVRRLTAFEYTIDISSSAPELVDAIGPVRDQSPGRNKAAAVVYSWQSMLGSLRDDHTAKTYRQAAGRYNQAAIRIP